MLTYIRCLLRQEKMNTPRLIRLLNQRFDGTVWAMGIDIAIREGDTDLLMQQLQSQYNDNPTVMHNILPEWICDKLLKNNLSCKN